MKLFQKIKCENHRLISLITLISKAHDASKANLWNTDEVDAIGKETYETNKRWNEK